jgi:class 3 adenylate cyclase
MQGRSLLLSSDVPPCAALKASDAVVSPPVRIEPNTEAFTQLEEQYATKLRAAYYVPIVATSTSPSDETDVVQFGVIEFVHLSKDDSVAQDGGGSSSRLDALKAAAIPSWVAGASSASASPKARRSGQDDGSTRSSAGEGNEPDAVSALSLRQLAQFGSYVATALQSLRLSDEDLQGERLLHRMLPKHVVKQLQKRVPEDSIVETCDHAFVLFSDIVGFTAYCAGREPRDVVVMLNSMCAPSASRSVPAASAGLSAAAYRSRCVPPPLLPPQPPLKPPTAWSTHCNCDCRFATFDALLVKHKVYKVTTIGDAYVAATGLPFMSSAMPQLDIVHFALDMIAAVQTFVTEDGQRMQIRVGMHVGPVAAGVVGIAMPRYCLFGDTVTIAEQLEEKCAHAFARALALAVCAPPSQRFFQRVLLQLVR